MFILLVFFMTSAGTVSSTTAEFNSADTCETAKTVVLAQAPGPHKNAVCVPK